MHLQTQIRVEALKTAIKNGDKKVEMVDKFSDEWKVTSRTIVRLIGTAQEELMNETNEKKDIINKVRRRKIAQAAEGDIISELEADIILCNILLGKMPVKKVYNTIKGAEPIEILPDHNILLKALDMYYKRMGSYKIDREEEKEKEVATEFHLEDDDEERVTGFRIALEDDYAESPDNSEILNEGLENERNVVQSNSEDINKTNIDAGLGELSEEGKINNEKPQTSKAAETNNNIKAAPAPPKMLMRYVREAG